MQKYEEDTWSKVHEMLDLQGFARIKSVLTCEECSSLIELYRQDELFRSTINMQRYRFGMGEYRYFNYPLPGVVGRFREMIYPRLVPVANEWMQRLGSDIRYPEDLMNSLNNAMQRASCDQRRWYCAMSKEVITRFTRICTAMYSFRSRLYSCFRNRKKILRVENLFLLSNYRERNPALQ